MSEQLVQLVESKRDKYIQLARRHGAKTREDAEDAVQDATVQALRAIGRFQGRSSLSSWFTRILINATYMQTRRPKPIGKSLDEPLGDDLNWGDSIPDKAPSAFQLIAEQQTITHALQNFKRLTPIRKATFCMFYGEGLTIRAISERTGLSESALKSRLRSARIGLRG
jgi:RNA polymerase sigma-70 factor (ECF subfamily)